MALPSLKTLRQADIDRLYDASLPWVETASVSGLAPFPVRLNYDPGFRRDHDAQAGTAVAYARKADWAAPAISMTVTAGGFLWRVADIPEAANAWEWRLKLQRDQRLRF